MAAVAGLASGPVRAAADPSFEQVLAAPDDVNLNFEYARAEARAGNLLNAAGALERILDQRPESSEARLFYVGVLLQLDDIQSSRGQLKLLKDADLTQLQRRQADEYSRRVGP